jgi:RNA polymerase sigma factor (TIGR02999 family)
MSEARDISGILFQAREGDAAAVNQLFHVVYEDLKRIAKAAEWDGQRNPTLNATAIVNELCLRWLSGGLPKLDAANRRTFFATVAKAVQDLLIDDARKRKSKKRGGHLARLGLEDDLADEPESPSVIVAEKLDHEALRAALDKLRVEAPRQAEVVMLRFYGGQGNEHISKMLGVDERTVRRDWKAARAFLNRELQSGVHRETR